MTGIPKKKLLRALAGEAMWPPPVWLMRQAGRYLPEFRALRAQADFMTRCMTPELAVEITLQPIRRYAMDGAILFSDILVLPWAMGQSLEFVEGRGPVLGAVRSRADLERLSAARVAEAVEPVRETLRRLRRELPAETTLIGFAGAPFTVACYMVEGGGSRDFAVTREMMTGAPEVFDRLMETLTQATAEMLLGQIEAGAEAIMLFDSWAGLLPPSQFRRYVIEPARQIVQVLRNVYPDIPVVGFPRLGGVMVGEYAEATGVNALALDTAADMGRVARTVPASLALQGNLDPLLLKAGGDVMRREALAIRDAMRGRPHVFNLGHGVVPQTPPEYVADLVQTLRETA